MEEQFYVCKSFYDSTKWMVRAGSLIKKKLPTSPNYSVTIARLFGLNYCECYRMIRDVYGATLYGKHGNYIGIAIKDKSSAEKLCKELNQRWNYILKSFD